MLLIADSQEAGVTIIVPVINLIVECNWASECFVRQVSQIGTAYSTIEKTRVSASVRSTAARRTHDGAVSFGKILFCIF